MLLHHGLALVVHFADGAARLVGAVTSEERTVWQLVHLRGASRAEELVSEEMREASELLLVLEALHDRRLLRRDGLTFAPIGVVA